MSDDEKERDQKATGDWNFLMDWLHEPEGGHPPHAPGHASNEGLGTTQEKGTTKGTQLVSVRSGYF